MPNEPPQGTARQGRQIPVSLDAPLWEQLHQAVEAETGMELSGNRFPRLQEAVARVVARQQSAVSLERILAQPRQRSAFLEQVCAELTVGESFFMRNEHHIRALREHVLPGILTQNEASREIRIWSAGCATGEEPYSLAILLDQVLDTPINQQSKFKNQKSDWNVHILGTDLNPDFLARARNADYGQWAFRGTDINNDRNYFSPKGKRYQLHPRLRQWVRFNYLNLVKDVYPSPMTGTMALDLILFRNVAIYLKKEVTQAIIGRFHRALRPGGWLLLGETELNIASPDGFEVIHFDQTTFYRKAGERDASPKPAATLPVSVLADVSIRTPLSDPRVAEPPDWVPLPTARKTVAPAPAVSSWERIERCVANKDFAEAERMIGSVPTNKERAALRVRYAQSLLACAEVSRAHATLDACLVDEPLSLEAQLLRGSFAEEAGDLDAAEQAYRRALYVDRFCAMAHFHLGLVQQQRGDFEASQRTFQLVKRMAGEHEPHAVVEYGEGVCYGRLLEMADRFLDS